MKIHKTVALSLVLLSLGGCQSFNSLFGANDRAAAQAPDMDSYFAQLINDGRRHIAANRPASATTAFRRASYHPDYAAEAYNGMAVAYDMMGRYDLAEQYFVAAIEAAPEDGRFARNLARFEDMMLARNGTRPQEQVQMAAALAPVTDSGAAPQGDPVQRSAPILAAALPQRMERVSSHEVRIGSRDDWGARLASADTLPQAVVHIGGGEALSPASAPVMADAAEPRYPVRIVLADVPAPQAAEDRTRFQNSEGQVAIRVSGELVRHTRQPYPVRITIGPS